MQRLSSLGLHVELIHTEGRFHTPRHEKALITILGLCNSFPGLKFPSVDEQAAPAFTALDFDLVTDNKLHE